MGFHLTVKVGNGEWSLRHDREATARPEPIGDRFRDIRTGRQVNAPEHIVRQTGMDENFGVALDKGLDLGLPLLGTAKARGDQFQENVSRRRGLAQKQIEGTAIGHAIATFADEDNRASLLDDAGGGTHAFHTLVEVAIEWMAAICRDNHVERLRGRRHRLGLNVAAALPMRLAQITCVNAGDPAIMSEGDVYEKGWPN